MKGSLALISVTLVTGPFLFSPLVLAQEKFVIRDWSDGIWRKKVAHEWRQEYLRLDSQIATLSPSEERWLKTEIDDSIREAGGKYTKRALDAMETREYAIRVAKPHVRALISVLSRIATHDFGSEAEEVLLWANTASLFIDKEFWQAVENLIRRGVIDKKVNGVEQFYFENHVLWARQILNDLVIEYFRRHLTERNSPPGRPVQ